MMEREQMEDLVAAYLDQDLGAEEAEDLHRELRGNPEARRYLLLASHTDIALYDLGRARHVAAPKRRSWLKPAIAACVLVGVALFLTTNRPSPLARIQTASGGVIVGAAEVAPGSSLSAGDRVRVLSGGSVRIDGPDGTVLEAGSDTTLTFSSATELDLEKGTLTATVSKRNAGAPPLVFRTPESEVRVLGTIFTLAVTPGRTRLDVREGRVRFKRLSDGHTVDVLADQHAVVGLPPGFIVAPGGTAHGDGSPERPWDLATALAHPAAVKPGDTIWLREGTYKGLFRSTLSGTREAPITVRAFGRERATVDGAIDAHGAWTTFRGFEIANSSPDRGPDRPAGLGLFGRGHKAVNLIVHDTGNPGIGFREDVGDGGEVSGCILWGNGITEPGGRPVGSAVSAQNREGMRRIRDTIAFRNFQSGIFVFAETGFADGFELDGNVVFDHPAWNIVATGGENPIRSLRVTDNVTYSRKSEASGDLVRFGLVPQAQNGSLVVRGNTLVLGTADEAFHLFQWKDVEVAGNTIVGRNVLARWTPGAAGTRRWNENTYFTDGTGTFLLPTARQGYSDWKTSTGFDEDSALNPWAPGASRVVVRPNPHEPGRAHVVVLNWGKRTHVDADLSRVLRAGDRYGVRDVQNYFGAPAAGGVFEGKTIAIPLAGEFSVFVVERAD
jgi:hypothetical protein